jgi:hypothetical protein
MTKEEQIIACESKLLKALRENDISTVEGLIHDNLLFNYRRYCNGCRDDSPNR